MTTPTEEPPQPEATEDDGYPNRRVLIAAVIGGIMLTIGMALAFTGGDSKRTPTPAVSLTPSISNTRIIPVPVAPPTTVPATPVKPVVRWNGTVTLNGPDSDKDLDSIPPRTHVGGADITGHWLETTLTAESANTQIAILPPSAPAPGFAQCRTAALATGTRQTQEIETGDVLCVLTSEGRIARLKTIKATQTSLDPVLTFRVTVWDPPTA